MRILLLGKVGQLGYELRRALPSLGEVTALDYPEIDFRRVDDAVALAEQARPDVIINAVAYTNVDKAESELETARLINATAPGALAEYAARHKAVFIHYSTDYVFDGRKGAPYVESDPVCPLNAYGQTKLEGEQAVLAAGGAGLVLRTAWVYSTRQGGFVRKVLDWARKQETMRLVTDQVSSPTWARSLAEVTAQLLARAGQAPYAYVQERAGLYHLGGAGAASRYEWGQAILEADPRREEQTVRQLLPAKTEEFPSPAERPAYSVLDCGKFEGIFDLRLPEWGAALRMALEE